MPIECKYRKDIELFAFDSLEYDTHKRFPLCGNFVGSHLARRIKESTNTMSSLNSSIVSFLEIKDGENPQKVYDENLIYNASGSLYDFIMSDAHTFVDTEITEFDELLKELKIADTFDKEIGKSHANWYDFFETWTQKIEPDLVNSFHKRFSKRNGPYYLSIHTHVPIVCLNGSLYNVKLNDSLEIDSFSEIPFCMTVIRKKGWPGGTA